jgi:uncharacterized protein YcbK (DUF882 family)
MIIRHYREVVWDSKRWENFSPHELACKHCGEFYYDEVSFDQLQLARMILDEPVVIYSGHRCALHNARVGGAPLSMHKKIAFDVALKGHSLVEMLLAFKQAGFSGFGYYDTFLHVDLGIPRRWWSKKGEKVWDGLIF